MNKKSTILFLSESENYANSPYLVKCIDKKL